MNEIDAAAQEGNLSLLVMMIGYDKTNMQNSFQVTNVGSITTYMWTTDNPVLVGAL